MRNKLSHGQLIRVQAGYGGHLLLHGRRLTRRGGHLPDGKSGECIFFEIVPRMSLTSNSDSLVSESEEEGRGEEEGCMLYFSAVSAFFGHFKNKNCLFRTISKIKT